jgi:superfamily II DNA or RNA helicase
VNTLEEQLLEIKQRKRFDAFTHLCDGFEAAGFQSTSVLLWLYAKKGLFMFDPGMGKTLSIAMGLKALFAVNPHSRCLFFIKKTQITQTSNDIRLYTGLRVVTCTAEKEEIIWKLYKNVKSYDVLMITHEALRSDYVCVFLQANLKYFNICVIDEAHYLTNIQESDRIFVLRAITSRIERVASLTATPFISKAEQYASLLNIMDPKLFERKDLLIKKLRQGIQLDTAYPLQIYNYDRKSEGIENTYNIHVRWVDPHDFQINIRTPQLLRQLRGPGSLNQLNDLITIIKLNQKKKKRGIVFIHYHDTRDWVLPFLKEANIHFGCIHGMTTQKERDEVQKNFQNGLLDIVVISVTTSINLDCDYIYFYQYTLEIKQILGRGERGLVPKVMDLYFLFTRHTFDAEYFLNTVYKQSHLVRSWIGKEYTEFLQVGGEVIENMGFNR